MTLSLTGTAPTALGQVALRPKLFLPGPTGGVALLEVAAEGRRTETFVATGSVIDLGADGVLTVDLVDGKAGTVSGAVAAASAVA